MPRLRDRVLSSSCALLLATALPLAADPAAGGAWSEARSESFTVVGGLPPEVLAAAAVDLERMRDALGQIAAAGGLGSAVPTVVYLFPDEESFAPYRPPGSTGVEGGYLVPGAGADYAAASGREPTRHVYKQYVLALLHRQLRGIPAWLRHGLAEYYGTFEADEREARIGLPLESHLHALGFFSDDLVPLVELLGMEAPSGGAGAGAASAFYPQAWLVVHHLMSGDDAHRRRIADYIHRTRRGEDPVAAFRESFGVSDLAEHAETLKRYAGGDSFTFLRVPVATPESYGVHARALSEAETAYRQGDLLTQLGPSHRAAAEAKLREAATLDPELWGAWLALGRLAEEAGDPAAAVEHYGRAVALAPDAFAAQLRYGTAKLGSLGGRRVSDEAGKATLAEAREALRRATELRPESGEAWAALGQAGLLAAEADPHAPAALEKAVALLPAERTDVLFNLLLARARTGDAAGVERTAGALREAGAEPGLLERARQVRLQLALQEGHRLATAGQLDDAVALFAVVRAESDDPAVAEQADALLGRVAKAAEHNRFAERYSEAVELYHAGDRDAARALVEEMLAAAPPGRQSQVLRELRARIQIDAGGG